MERQLSVWAAPGLVLFLVLCGALFGNPTGGSAGASEEDHAVAEVAEVDEPTTTDRTVVEDEEEPNSEETTGTSEEETTAGDEEEDDGGDEEIVKTGDGPTGTVSGRIVFKGTPPVMPDVLVGASQMGECCDDKMIISDRSLQVDENGGVADVVVTIKAKGVIADGAGQVIEMDQICCRFEPHVLLVPQGATVRYKNSDQTTHNVNIQAKKNPKKNPNLAGGSSLELGTVRDEEIPISCSIHTWMKSNVVVSKYTTVAKTAPDGTFEIPNVPPGEWSVDIWGEEVRAVVKRLKVTVEAGATTKLEWQVKKK